MAANVNMTPESLVDLASCFNCALLCHAGRVPLPHSAKPDLAFCKNRKRAETALLLEFALSRLPVESALSANPQRRGAAGSMRPCSTPCRAAWIKRPRDADPSPKGRAPVRHVKNLNGYRPFPHQNARSGERRDEPACARLQPQTRVELAGHRCPDGRDEDLRPVLRVLPSSISCAAA